MKNTQGKRFSMQIRQAIQFTNAPIIKKLQYNNSTITLTLNKNKIDFYKDYPTCHASIYPNAMLDYQLKQQLISQIRKVIANKKTEDALSWLLNFVQLGFNYKTDNNQFGYEKYFFVDEILYYPFSDCEDKSIFFSWLVHHLLQLDVILLEYTDHMATAVCINTDRGETINHNSRNFTICDPTYKNAAVGQCMPKYKGQIPKKIPIFTR